MNTAERSVFTSKHLHYITFAHLGSHFATHCVKVSPNLSKIGTYLKISILTSFLLHIMFAMVDKKDE